MKLEAARNPEEFLPPLNQHCFVLLNQTCELSENT
jgi:hypothetical protein